MMQDDNLEQAITKRIKELPVVLQHSIANADIAKNLRSLAELYKLHLDQWDVLENEVMLALLGFQPIEKLRENIEHEVGVPADVGAKLTSDISRLVFEPIRAELERELADSEQRTENREQTFGEGEQKIESSEQRPTPVVPATPPPPAPTGTAVRAPISESYAAQEPSHTRKVIEGDPYREQIQ